jgi:predicted ATPase
MLYTRKTGFALGRPPVPFVGREVELAALRTALRSTQDGRGQMAIVSGDAGIGKTSIIRAFAHA